ncbi:MAG TPA: ATP:cob(I)alamin adenosyltransferase, partial [Acidimicrobiales bacterium]|nr:ATP:cob(I)alamin adenosyltransferase [Acidimicrobiales bacterium]
MKIYTRKGDDGTTGLYGGGRVPKDSSAPEAYGTVDEAQAALGLARAASEGELDELLVHLERDLWVLMAELATEHENAHKLVDGASRVTPEMVAALEVKIDEITGRFEQPTEFVVP